MKTVFYAIFALLIFSSCIEIEEFSDTPRGNFDALWKILDERYCFFDYKDVDWNSVYEKYFDKINNDMDDGKLFYVLNMMLQELRDGHVNLYTPFDVGRYWKWYEDYPDNYNAEIIEKYLGTDYSIAGGFRYKILDKQFRIGYLQYSSFSASTGDTNLNYILGQMNANCDGIIIDIRNNGGGLLSNVEKIAARFVEEKTHIGYIQHKTGKGHNDFSEPVERYIEPAPSNCVRWQKPVVVLTNRRCFSAANDFVNAMRYCPNVTILGDRTGGGSGLPFSSELPNGWSVRFSACPVFDADMQQIEFGIDPDVQQDMNDYDESKNLDTLIELASYMLRYVLNK
jgi:hypothetical protein